MLRDLPKLTTPEQDHSSPYFPFQVALERGVLDLTEIEPRTLDEQLGVTLANGSIPLEQAGVFSRGRGEILACDHVSLVKIGTDKTLLIGPSSKEDIDDEGEIKGAGALVLSSPEGFLKFIGVAINKTRQPWAAIRPGFAIWGTGSIAVKLFGLEATDYEVDEVRAESGLVIAKPRRAVY